jgi:hypothetical protein
MPGPRPDDAGWATYLGALECALAEIDAALATDREPVLPPLAQPQGPAPTWAGDGMTALYTALLGATARVEERRDQLRHQIAALPSPRPQTQADRESHLGDALDLVG